MKRAVPVKVWDLPTRLFHWTLVLLLALLWMTGEWGGLDVTVYLPGQGETYFSNMDIHGFAGQGVLVLILFRVLWGLWGSTTARFSHFVRGPVTLVAKFKSLLKGDVSESTGHNPLGGMMVILMLLVLAAQALTGMFSADDLFYEGPLAHWLSTDTVALISTWHHRLFLLVQCLVALHILAISLYFWRGNNLITAMFTGKRELELSSNLQYSPVWLSLLSLSIAVGLLALLRSL